MVRLSIASFCILDDASGAKRFNNGRMDGSSAIIAPEIIDNK